MWRLFLFSFVLLVEKPKALKIYSPCQALEKIARNQEKEPIVERVKNIEMAGLKAGYNPSVVRVANKNYLFFRYDVENIYEGYGDKTIKSFVACAVYDQEMEQLLELKEIGFDSSFAQDPRAIYFQGFIYVFCNKPVTDPLDAIKNPLRRMCVAKIDPETLEVVEQAILEFALYDVEKNWIPFVGEDEKGVEALFLIHDLKTSHILRLDATHLSVVYPVYVGSLVQEVTDWEADWGKVGGGTPAVRIGDEYIHFFHSRYVPEMGGVPLRYYVMGAASFDAKPPFQLKRISKEPIVFDGMYQSPFRRSNLYSAYPSGVYYDEQSNQIQVSLGENDRTMKMMYIDKDALNQQMQSVTMQTPHQQEDYQ